MKNLSLCKGATLLVACLSALAPGGCTFEDGVGFARVSGSLASSFAGLEGGAGRLTPDGWYRTDQSFELKLAALDLVLRDLRLLGSSGPSSATAAGGSCVFDPADPPEGCTLCHGGHCHCDGKLVSYDDLKKQVCAASSSAGSGRSAATLVKLTIGKAQSLATQGGSTLKDLPCAPSCQLKRGQVDSVSLVADRLKISATLRDGSSQDRFSGKQPALTVDLDLAGASLSLTLPSAELVDRDQPQNLVVQASLPVTARLLDQVAFHQLTQSGGNITIGAASNRAAGEQLATNLALTPLGVKVTRSDD